MKKYLLVLIYLAVLIHFLKDITQDILKIRTLLDIFGNVEENLEFLPASLQSMYTYGLGGLAFIAEIALLIFIPKMINGKATSKNTMAVKLAFGYIVVFFLVCTYLDPRFHN